MNMEKRKLNKLIREFRAMKLLDNEAKLGNAYAGNIHQRIIKVKGIIAEVSDIRKTDPNFLNGEFLKELEAEKRMLIDMTLQYGWPKTYLADLFKRQREDRIQNKKRHV